MSTVDTSQVIASYKIFKKSDTSGDGHLDIGEFRKILENKGKKDLAEGTLKSINSSKDGKIDIYEFLSFLLEKPTFFKGKEEGENDDDYITRIQNRNEEYSKYINFSLQRNKTEYIKRLELKKKNNFDYFKTVFSESNITDDYLEPPPASPTSRVARLARSTSRAQRERQGLQAQSTSVPNIKLSKVNSVVGEPTPRTVKNEPYKKKMNQLRNNYESKLSEFKNFKNNKKNFKENLKQQLTILCSSELNINLSTIPSLSKDDEKMLFSIYWIISINDIFMENYLEIYLQDEKKKEIKDAAKNLCDNIKELIENKNSNVFRKNFDEFCNKLERLLDLFKNLISGVKIDLNKKVLNELYFDISSLLSKYQKEAHLTSREQGKKNAGWDKLDLSKKYKRLETNYENLNKNIGTIINNLDNINNENIDYLFENFIKIDSSLKPKTRGQTGNMKKRFIIDLLKKLKEIIDGRLDGNIVMPDYEYLDKEKIKKYLE